MRKWSELLPGDVYYYIDNFHIENSIKLVISSPVIIDTSIIWPGTSYFEWLTLVAGTIELVSGKTISDDVIIFRNGIKLK